MWGGSDLRLGLDDFRMLRELLNDHAGLWFGPESRSTLERRLRERVTALDLSSFGEYYHYLRFHERGRAELEEAIDVCTINETYFFREEYQLRALRDEILPALINLERVDPVHIWSAGCATGEEVYTIAMTTDQAPKGRRSIRVFGTDISRRCVAAARKGVYGSSAFRATPESMRERYFVERNDGAHIVDGIKSMCHFGHLNLVETSRAAMVGRVDVIFCRNVLIYFDDTSRRRVIDMFYDRLVPGGHLLLGHSESLLNVSTAFELVQLKEDLVYRKPKTASLVSPQPRSYRSPSRLPEWISRRRDS